MTLAAILHGIAYTTAACGAVWLLRSMIGDRPRGRKRCPKCWYGLDGVPPRDVDGRRAWLCPECGRTVASERRLFRVRRPWRRAVAALLVLILAYGLWTTPRVRRDGWFGAVPTTALIAALNWTEPADDDMRWWQAFANRRRYAELQHPCFFHLSWRAEKDDLPDWQWRWLGRICMHRPADGLSRVRAVGFAKGLLLYEAKSHGQLETPAMRKEVDALVTIATRTRDAWPAGLPVWVQMHVDRWEDMDDVRVNLTQSGGDASAVWIHGGYHGCGGTVDWDDDQVRLAPPPAAQPVTLNISIERRDSMAQPDDPWRKVDDRTIHMLVKTVPSVDSILRPVPAAAVSDALLTGERPWIQIIPSEDGAPPVVILNFDPPEDAMRAAGNLTFAVKIEVLRDAVVVYEAEAWWGICPQRGDPGGVLFPFGDVCLRPVRADTQPSNSGDWTVRFRSDPVMALRNFDSDRYWSGQVTIPTDVVGGPDDPP